MEKEARIKELKHLIGEDAQTIREASGRRAENRAELALLLCPYKVGDTIVDKRGRHAVISKIQPGRYSMGNDFALYGHILKKDKTPGKLERTLYHYDSWRKAEEVDRG